MKDCKFHFTKDEISYINGIFQGSRRACITFKDINSPEETDIMELNIGISSIENGIVELGFDLTFNDTNSWTRYTYYTQYLLKTNWDLLFQNGYYSNKNSDSDDPGQHMIMTLLNNDLIEVVILDAANNNCEGF